MENTIDKNTKNPDPEMDPQLRETYMEAYEQQVRFAPGYFPKELLAFAKKENLHIPLQVKK